MVTPVFVNLIGSTIAELRHSRSLTQKQLQVEVAAYFKLHRAQYPGLKSAAGASRFNNIENAVLGDKESRKALPVAQLLADALQVPLASISVPAESRRRGPRPGPRTKPGPVASEVNVTHSAESLRLVGPISARGTVTLPFIATAARPLFVAMKATGAIFQADDSRSILIGKNPLTMYTNAKVFEVDGDSMEPEIKCGDEVVAVLVPEDKWERIQNCVVVVGYGDTLTIKKIVANDLLNKGTLMLRPWRNDLAPSEVRRIDIHCIYRVIEVQPKPFRPIV